MNAPNFKLKDQNSNYHTLEDYKGKWLIVYFYPKDDTPGCTKEACNFRDGRELIREAGAEVVGISKDSSQSHLKFATKHNLSFTLLSDPEATTIKAYGALGEKKMFGKTFLGIKRNCYLINPAGQIVKEYLGVNPSTIAGDILKDLDALRVKN